MDGGGQEGLGKKEPGMGQGERLEGGRVCFLFLWGFESAMVDLLVHVYMCVSLCVCMHTYKCYIYIVIVCKVMSLW